MVRNKQLFIVQVLQHILFSHFHHLPLLLLIAHFPIQDFEVVVVVVVVVVVEVVVVLFVNLAQYFYLMFGL